MSARLAFRHMLLGLCEAAQLIGIKSIVCNYEPRMIRLYRSSGAIFEEVGRAGGFGPRHVCCGVFETSSEALALMRDAVGLKKSIIDRPPDLGFGRAGRELGGSYTV